ncbi:MAG: pitrilysin family protein [Eubacteriales bacterium]|nr:pitrilysin family protein [Eubacteriales bacterium]
MVTIETLISGIRLVYERIAHFSSVSVGIWVGTGSVDEQPDEYGLSHILEHMVFKGTASHSAADLAFAMDSVGGNINAFTSKELTCYYAKVAGEHLPVAIDILYELAMKPTLREDDMQREKQVLLEEISMIEDSPEDLVQDLIGEAFFQGHNLANPISSTAEIVEAYSVQQVRDYYQTHYMPANMVISVAGNFDEEQLKSEIARRFGTYPAAEPILKKMPKEQPDGCRRILLKDRDFEQTHICLALRGYRSATNDIYPTMVLNNILGGSMSSRLFQKVREEQGMVYSIYSYPSFFRQMGMFGIYAAMKNDNVAPAMDIIGQEINALYRGEITAEEFRRAKEQLKGNFALSQDGLSSRMNAMGKNLLLHNRVISEQETMAKISAVTMEDVQGVARYICQAQYAAAAAVGKISHAGRMKNILLGW